LPERLVSRVPFTKELVPLPLEIGQVFQPKLEIAVQVVDQTRHAFEPCRKLPAHLRLLPQFLITHCHVLSDEQPRHVWQSEPLGQLDHGLHIPRASTL
jgi:hypothetical protein